MTSRAGEHPIKVFRILFHIGFRKVRILAFSVEQVSILSRSLNQQNP